MAFKNEGAGSVGAQAQNPEIEEQEESRSPKKRKDNVALTFKNHLLALGYTAHQGMICEWTGSHWNTLRDDIENLGGGCVKMALTWMEANARDAYSHNRAVQMIQTAVNALPEAPEPAKEPMIPCRNVWFRIEGEGADARLIATRPDRSQGVYHSIDVDFNVAEGASYQPRPVPKESSFGRFLDTSLPNLEVRQAVQEYCAYTLMTSARKQIGQVWEGDGRNGKGVLLNILKSFHGKGKVAAIDLDDSSDFALSPVIGASLVWVDEAPKRINSTNKIKSLIAGDPVSINRKNLPQVSYSSSAKWIICTNHGFKASDASIGFWERFQIIRWTSFIPESMRQDNLDAKIIETEKGFVLDWLLAGLISLHQRGGKFLKLDSAAAARQEALKASDTIIAWSSEVQPETAHGVWTPKLEIFSNYREWCSDCNRQPVSSQEFWKRMAAIFSARQTGAAFAEDRKRIRGEKNPVFCVNVRLYFGEAFPQEEEPDPVELFGGKYGYPAPEARM